jgi:transposase
MVYNIEIKAKAIYTYARNKSCRKTAIEIGCSKSSVSNWVKQADSCVLGIQKTKNRYNYKITTEIAELVKKEVAKCAYLKLKEIKDIVKGYFDIELSTSSIRKCLKISHISRKKSKKFVVKSKAYYDKLEIQRKEFIENIIKLDKKYIISIDETAIYKQMKPSYGYSLKGQPVIETVTNQRHEKYSLIIAITSDKVLHYEIHKGSINRDIYIKFISALIDIIDCKNKYYFLMDNVRFHHNKIVKSIIKENNDVIYTPPYSPELNPIEIYFSVVKSKLRYMLCENIFETKSNLKKIISSTSIHCKFNKFYDFSFNLNNHQHYKIIKNRFFLS